MADFGKYYRAYMYMQELLKNDFTYNYINEKLKDGDKGEDTLIGNTSEKVIDMDWVVAMEETLPYIQKAIDEQRRFIKQIDNVVRVELAKQVGPDSVKHLAQHTNFIAKVEGDVVTPNKVLTIEREESFAIYENRVLMTLIHKALLFVDDKYSKMKDVPNDSNQKMNVLRHLELEQQKVDISVNFVNEVHETLSDDLDVVDLSTLSDFDRIRRIRSTLNEFLSTPLMKEISNEPEVRPPITQTNLLKKNPNFKKAMDLWNFLDSYKKDGFELVSEEYDGSVSDEVKQNVYFSMNFQHFMLTLATNPALRKMLHEKYEEENARIAEEANRPEKIREQVWEAKLEALRKEEMEIRLKEIREREKKILELTSEVKNLKNIIEQKEQQILTLKGRISMLEDEVNELKEELKVTKLKLLEAENKIKELTEENEQLKAKIAELEAHIEELNATIDELNNKIQVLNDRVQVLLQENARLETKVKEQEEKIAEQAARIAELEAQVAEQLATIAALTENIQKCESKIAEDEKQIADLTDRNQTLTDTLQTERQQTKEREEKMNADFEAKTQAAEEKHKAEVKEFQNKLDNAEVAHTEYVAKLNADFADKSNKAEQKRIADLNDQQKSFEQQIEKIKQSNADAAAAVNAKHASEIKKVQKSVDKRVEEAEKAAEKRMQAKANEISKNARDEIRKAEKKAGEKASAAREEARALKSSADLIGRDYAFGSVEIVAAYAEQLATESTDNLAAKLINTSKTVKSVALTRNKKDIILSLYSPNGTRLIKKYKKAADFTVALDDACEQLNGIADAPVCITYSGVDSAVADTFLMAVNKSISGKATVKQNKSLKSNEIVAIYFNKG